MLMKLKFLLSVFVVSALFGCAGRDFVRPDPEGLKNGQSTYAQVIQKMGPPAQEGTAMKNDQTVKTAVYAYASVGGKPLRDGVTPARAIGLYFFKETLVGHEFISSWAEDHTDFDDSKITEIVKGKTNRAAVVQLLGKPSGQHIYPLIKSTSGAADVYLYTEVRGFTPFRKMLIVTFDAAGIVTDLEFSTAGKRGG